MKTIDEASDDYMNKVWAESVAYEWDSNELKQFCKSDFKSGVEFAQRWIPVEEELPENEMDIIAKNDYYCEAFRFFTCGLRDKDYLNGSFAHWRPIELK